MTHEQLVADIGGALKRPVLWVRQPGNHTYWQWAGYAWCDACGAELKSEEDVYGVGKIEQDGRKVVVFVCADREACRERFGKPVSEEPDLRTPEAKPRKNKFGFTEA